MPRMIEMEYNPYIPQLKIVIDGHQPPDFSRLIQYFDEDIWKWSHEVIGTIYAEVRDNFVLSFTGTEKDTAIIRFVCENYKHCVGFKHKRFLISDSLPKRMRKLNQLIKRTGITVYEKTVIDATFLIPPQMQYYLEDIMAIDINNMFCAVRINTIGLKSSFDEANNDILFILSETFDMGIRYLQRLTIQKPAFILAIGDNNKVLAVEKNFWCIETTQDQLFNNIFSCFIQMPLVYAFRKCINSIRGGNKIAKELKLISCTEPLVVVTTGKEVEIGKSIRVMTSLEPDIGAVPKLIYKVRNQQVATCDGMYIYGLMEGSCVLEVYRTGSKQPFFTKEVRVYKRNRITKLILSDDTLSLGTNDKKQLVVSCYPSDADNKNAISWKSSDENIVRIDTVGCITAISPGTCRIICTAENVSAQCCCTVKPYLQDLVFDFITDNSGTLAMVPMQELRINIKRVPDECIDDEIDISSSDCDVVNVVNSILFAKKDGEATITVKNSSARISRSFNVVVSKVKQQKNRTGFFRRLFQ